MKALLFILIAISLASFAADKPEKIRKKKNKTAPPGTVWLKDSLYFDRTECRNIDYREYLFWLQKNYGDQSNEYKNALPDTLVWRDKLAYCEPYVEYYFRHPAYAYYPMVGVSYDQAEAYCKWRSDRVNEWYMIKEKKISYEYYSDVKNRAALDEMIKKNQKVKYRLPSKEEWEYAAKGGLDNSFYPWGGPYLRDYRGCFEANFKVIGDENIEYNDTIKDYQVVDERQVYISDNADITSPVDSYKPNGYGIFNMSGNAAEMISNRGITKGGSWRTTGYHLRIDVDGKYEKPAADIGFRCICEVLY